MDSLDDQIVGVDVAYAASIDRPFGESLVWPVIPGDYFFTKLDKPAWKMTINDEGSSISPVVVCTDCSTYEYSEGAAEVVGFTRTGTELDIDVTGIDTLDESSI